MDSEVGQGDRETKLAKLSHLQSELGRALEALGNEAPNDKGEHEQLQVDISRMQEEVDGLKKDLGIEA